MRACHSKFRRLFLFTLDKLNLMILLVHLSYRIFIFNLNLERSSVFFAYFVEFLFGFLLPPYHLMRLHRTCVPESLQYVLGSRVVDLQLIWCFLYWQALFFNKHHKSLPFPIIHMRVVFFIIGLLLLGVLDYECSRKRIIVVVYRLLRDHLWLLIHSLEHFKFLVYSINF